MGIYELNDKKLKEEIRKFNKTNYGKITFLLSYSLPIIFIIISIILIIMLYCCNSYDCGYWWSWSIISLLCLNVILILVSFILGSVHYYHELKEYIGLKSK